MGVFTLKTEKDERKYVLSGVYYFFFKERENVTKINRRKSIIELEKAN
jgi:transcription initiation factor IIE alpha subunit